MDSDLVNIINNYFHYYPKKNNEDCWRFLFNLKDKKDLLKNKEEYLLFIQSSKSGRVEVDSQFKEKYLKSSVSNHSGKPVIEPINEKVVVRFAPNPNFPPTLGNLRGWILNKYFYDSASKGSEIYLRFDDTDPKNKPATERAKEEYISMVKTYLPETKIVHSSERFDLYYQKTKSYLKEGLLSIEGYSGESPIEELDLMINGKSSYTKIKTKDKIKDIEVKKDKGETKTEEYCLRVIPLVDQKIKNKNNYCLFPTLVYETTLEDHFLKITHALRGKDLMALSTRQKRLAQYLNLSCPLFKYWGRIKIISQEGTVERISSSKYAKLAEEVNYQDLENIYTYDYFIRKGIKPLVLEKYMLSYGFTENDINLEIKRLYSFARKSNMITEDL